MAKAKVSSLYKYTCAQDFHLFMINKCGLRFCLIDAVREFCIHMDRMHRVSDLELTRIAAF